MGKFPVCGWVGKFTVCVDGWGSFQCVGGCVCGSLQCVGGCREVSSVRVVCVEKFPVCVDGWGSFQCVWVCWEVSRVRVGVCAEVSSVWVDVRKFPVYGWCVWGSF